MHRMDAINSVGTLFSEPSKRLPDAPGVYAFWWIGERSQLLKANRQIILKGPREEPVAVEYRDWWPKELAYPCLYVGKTTSVRKRFSMHIKRKCPGRLHESHPLNWKAVPRTTSCQVRWGIEHIFPTEKEPLRLIFANVGFSCRTDFAENAIAERFFEEDRLVGAWRPWFNIDSER